MSEFYCITIQKAEKEKFENALSDFLCWMDGFTQGGGKYSPDTTYTLRDLRDLVRRGYATIPPEPPKPIPTLTAEAPLEMLGISTSLIRKLREHGLKNVGQVATSTETQIMSVPGCGRESRFNISMALKKHGLRFAMLDSELPHADREVVL